MRFITIILLLLVFFFGGVTYGTMETNYSLSAEMETEKEKEKEEWMEMEPFEPEQLQVEEAVSMDKEVAPVHKIANFFERLVVSIYELFINAMYYLANMFF